MIKKIHVKKGETVMVVSGKDKNKKGKVLVVMPKTGKVIVEGINDTKENTDFLKNIKKHKNVEKIELLPFKKLCVEKYKKLGITFPIALAAPVEAGIMFIAQARPLRALIPFLWGISNVAWSFVYAWTVVM